MKPPALDPRGLDEKLVPRAARLLRTALDAVARGRVRAEQGLRSAWAAAWAASRRADQRWAARGPLALLRDVPQLALLLVAVVFVSGAAAAVLLAEDERTAASSPGDGAGAVPPADLGVPPGSDVDAHLAQARTVVEGLAEQRPDAGYLALVHLDRYLRVDELPALLDGTDPQRAYLRAATAGPQAEVIEVPLVGTEPATLLGALCDATATRKTAEAEELASLAATIEVTTPEEELSRADFEAESARAATEAQVYGGTCEAVLALVVEAPASALLALADRDGVRGVEVAPAGATVTSTDVTPLLPETTGTVPTGTER